MDNLQLDYLGKKCLGERYIGTFPLNSPPFYLKPNTCFIINTQSANLPGEHWLAVNITYTNIELFDPFGLYYPSSLVNYLTRSSKHVTFNRKQYQDFNTNLCGYYCLKWLVDKYKYSEISNIPLF